MNYNWQISGHQKQIEFLEKAIQQDKIAHAYIFAGPQHIGKFAIASRFAQILICDPPSQELRRIGSPCDACAQCKSFMVAANADFITVDGADGIKIEKIRELSYKLSLKSYMAKYKVAVIDGAENLTLEAANALLKLLEEPKPNTVIILVTSNPYKLPRTISSRAQKINFGFIESNLEVDQSQKDNFYIFLNGDLVSKLQLASDLAQLDSSEVEKTINLWLLFAHHEILENHSLGFAAKVKALINSKKYLEQNANLKLMLTDLMVNY